RGPPCRSSAPERARVVVGRPYVAVRPDASAASPPLIGERLAQPSSCQVNADALSDRYVDIAGRSRHRTEVTAVGGLKARDSWPSRCRRSVRRATRESRRDIVRRMCFDPTLRSLIIGRSHGPLAQWIEHAPSKRGMRVRFSHGPQRSTASIEVTQGSDLAAVMKVVLDHRPEDPPCRPALAPIREYFAIQRGVVTSIEIAPQE